VIVDGSKHAACADASRRAAGDHRTKCGHDIVYVGASERAIIRQTLVAMGVRSSVLDGALTIDGIGGNRNVGLLVASGRRVLLLDDDVLCVPWSLSAPSGAVALGGHTDPYEWAFFADRASAIAKGGDTALDILGAHGGVLGRSLPDVLAGSPVPPDWQHACAHLLLRVSRREPVQVRATVAGLAGDAAVDCPARLLFTHGGVRRLLQADPAALETAFLTREVRRVTSATVITHHPACMAYCMGVDGTVLVPPCTPIGRNEDGVFAALLTASDRGATFAHLPHGIIHDSNRPSRRSERMISATRTRLAELVNALVRTAASTTLPSDPVVRLQRIGTYLIDVSRLGADFAPFVKETMLAARGRELSAALEEAAARSASQPWTSHVEEYERQFAASLVKPDFFVPEEFADSGSGAAGFARAAQFLGGFGDLISVWPDVWNLARGAAPELVDRFTIAA
jgi:hypothetical protein